MVIKLVTMSVAEVMAVSVTAVCFVGNDVAHLADGTAAEIVPLKSIIF